MDYEQAYDFLGVSRKSGADKVKKAYKSKVFEHHPDHGGTEDGLIKLTEAYSAVLDDLKNKIPEEKHDELREMEKRYIDKHPELEKGKHLDLEA